MIFSFLKYIKPIWYFNLKPKVDYCYFPTYHQLELAEIDYCIDKNYISLEAQQRDVAWTAFQQGVILQHNQSESAIWTNEILPVQDEYVFLRKNFHTAWVTYVLVVRIVSLHNPFVEIGSFVKSRTSKRVDFTVNKQQHARYSTFESPLIQSNPLVSIVIPTLNRYKYLKDVLLDLEQQTYTHFEVIIVDQTDAFQADFYKGWKLQLHFWQQTEKALWRARNEAIQAAKGHYILLYDDDSRVESDWIEQHLKTLDYFKADVSSGVSISKVGDVVPKHYYYFRWSDQLDTGNVLLKKSIFNQIGFFDLQFEKQRMGDGEFGLRAYLAGFKNISNYKAKRLHLKVSQGGLRQMGSWDGWRPKKVLGPRPVPSVLYLTRKYFGNTLSKWYVLHAVMPSLIPYQFKKSKLLKLLSFVLLPFSIPLVLFQVVKSWQLASKKLEEGSKIEMP